MSDTERREIEIDDFNNDFKKKYFEGEVLSDEALNKICEIFGARKRGEDYSMSCDENHTHRYSCIHFKNPQRAVVDRLIQEIRHYREQIKKSKEKLGLDEF